MPRHVPGLHHVTAVAGDPQVNLDFWTGPLGLSLVKVTVNFDAPDMYHLYFGDPAATPGALYTTFPIPGAARGRAGTGQAVAVAYALAPEALAAAAELLAAAGVETAAGTRFGEPVLTLADPDGQAVELVGTSSVPAFGFHSATLALADPEPTARLLTDVFGYEPAGREPVPGGERLRFSARGEAHGRLIDLLRMDGMPPARPGAGTIHHLAFRAADAAMQADLAAAVRDRGLAVTEVRDRQYFRSVYFREPGGVLFEIATDGPGFAVDEPDGLGRGLRLPPRLEARRAEIARALPPLRLPA